MRFCSLGSGSRGNATLVEGGGTRVLVDCGFSLTETETRLRRQGCAPEDLAAILVTHEHGDHIRGVAALSRRYGIPVYLSAGTWRGYGRGDISALQRIEGLRPLQIGDLRIEPVPVPHDACEPCQYLIGDGRRRLGILTDLGSVSAHVLAAYQNCDALVLEFNHDERLLHSGPYPPRVRERVASDWGHLSNGQAAALLDGLPIERLQHLLIAHVSETNNTPAHARAALAGCRQQPDRVHWAAQDGGCDWLQIR